MKWITMHVARSAFERLVHSMALWWIVTVIWMGTD